MLSGMSFANAQSAWALSTLHRTTFVELALSFATPTVGELEQIQFLLGHASVLTTERYLGSKQNLVEPVNDRFGPLYKCKTSDIRGN